MDRFHSPPSETSIDDSTPLIFLAGPVQGALDWQKVVANEVLSRRNDVEIASPRRQNEIDFIYRQQVEWEKKHLARSVKLGSVVFWFAGQDHRLKYEPGRAYAQTSRIEIGRLFGWHDFRPFPLIVGFDPNYTKKGGGNQRYIESMCDEKEIQVVYSLEALNDDIVARTPTRLTLV